MLQPLINLESPTLRYTGVTLANPAAATINTGLSVVIGPNGAGKTTLAHILERGWNFATNRISSPRGRIEVRHVEFNDIHSLSGFKAEYYQQRYEAGMNIEVPTVAEVLGDRIASAHWARLALALGLQDYEHKPMNALSSGELRKLLVLNQLTDAPDLLILDNPYIGLDVEARAELDAAMLALTRDSGVNIMLLLCNQNEIPQFASSIIPMRDLTIYPAVESVRGEMVAHLFDYAEQTDAPLPEAPDTDFGLDPNSPIVEMQNCRVTYGNTTILDHVDWRILPGERWILSGRNGSGKSTLLSLIHADNPKAYAMQLSLFGRCRGTGESIWDIKRRIGYVSPEMHLYFNGGHSLGLHVVAQGLNDTVGQYKKLTDEQLRLAGQWIDYLNLNALADRPFRTLSAGEQRMLLLARTLIKQPPLLILDEPLHGLDQARKQAVRRVVERIGLGRDMAMVYVTHRREEAPQSCTLVAHIADKTLQLQS